MKKKINIIGLLILVLGLASCTNEATLQSYYVDHQDNKNFMVIDLPASLLLNDNSQLPEKDQKVIKSIKKAVVLALPLNGNNQDVYEKERSIVEGILENEKYNLLMRMGSSQSGIRISYLGEEDAIDEIVVYGNDDQKGFAVARILGDDMNVGAILKLAKSIGKGDANINIDTDALEPLMKNIFKGNDSLNHSQPNNKQNAIRDTVENTL